MIRRRGRWAGALLLLAMALAAAVVLAARHPPAADPGAPLAEGTTPSPGVGVAAARAALRGLAVVERDPDDLPAYARDAFGPAWSDVDGNGCNQRDDVLLRDAVPGSTRVQRQGPCDHDVLAGRWLDPYTGRALALDDLKDPVQAQAIQIDHVVPLAEAWRSGASAWSDTRRERFADDLDALLAVDGPTNASKGDDDPAAWRPRAAYQCTYAVRWITVKSHWGLAADAAEVRALGELLARCP